MLRRTIGQNDLVVSYNTLLGLGMITEVDCLKWSGQKPNSIQALMVLTIFVRHLSSDIMTLRVLHVMWLGPGAKVLLYLEMVSLNSVLEKRGYSSGTILGISSRKSGFKGKLYAELYDLSSVFHRRSKEVHGAPLYLIVLMAGLDFFRVHTIRSHGRLLKEAISVILLSKKMHLAYLIEFLNVRQSFKRPLFLYV